ncbi:Gpi-anchor transamidase [Pseudoloma neurophilia]|uniref:Gpi-anchor transamidase n=1 Tax=Pseudoloma neurophilia TaxID=146866 RepID=A0A0R0LY35_9MICR|nr:Gpi-anchor transamidase [Pseudoloma neurophilia]
MFLFHLLCTVMTKNFAFLVNSSQYWKNMRHSANMHVFYKLLRNNGFDDSEMVIFTADDFSFDERTYHFGKYQTSTIRPAVTKLPFGPFTPEMIYETIMGNHEKLIDMDSNSNFFIYFTGHGNEYFLKLHNKHFITTPCLETALIKLSKRVKRAFVIFDTCRAESLLVKETLPENIVVLTTSNFNEDSMSFTFSHDDDICSVDDFADFVQIHSEKGFNKTILRFFEEISRDFKVASTLTLYPKIDWKISDFIVQDNTEKEIEKFIL